MSWGQGASQPPYPSGPVWPDQVGPGGIGGLPNYGVLGYGVPGGFGGPQGAPMYPAPQLPMAAAWGPFRPPPSAYRPAFFAPNSPSGGHVPPGGGMAGASSMPQLEQIPGGSMLPGGHGFGSSQGFQWPPGPGAPSVAHSQHQNGAALPSNNGTLSGAPPAEGRANPGPGAVHSDQPASRQPPTPTVGGAGSADQRSHPIRPQAISLLSGGGSSQKRSRASGSMKGTGSWERGSMSDKNREGSATSDENNHPRLVPVQGAGPRLRDHGGQQIDEYLMRLLKVGAANAAVAAMYRQESAQQPDPEQRAESRSGRLSEAQGSSHNDAGPQDDDGGVDQKQPSKTHSRSRSRSREVSPQGAARPERSRQAQHAASLDDSHAPDAKRARRVPSKGLLSDAQQQRLAAMQTPEGEAKAQPLQAQQHEKQGAKTAPPRFSAGDGRAAAQDEGKTQRKQKQTPAQQLEAAQQDPAHDQQLQHAVEGTEPANGDAPAQNASQPPAAAGLSAFAAPAAQRGYTTPQTTLPPAATAAPRNSKVDGQDGTEGKWSQKGHKRKASQLAGQAAPPAEQEVNVQAQGRIPAAQAEPAGVQPQQRPPHPLAAQQVQQAQQPPSAPASYFSGGDFGPPQSGQGGLSQGCMPPDFYGLPARQQQSYLAGRMDAYAGLAQAHAAAQGQYDLSPMTAMGGVAGGQGQYGAFPGVPRPPLNPAGHYQQLNPSGHNQPPYPSGHYQPPSNASAHYQPDRMGEFPGQAAAMQQGREPARGAYAPGQVGSLLGPRPQMSQQHFVQQSKQQPQQPPAGRQLLMTSHSSAMAVRPAGMLSNTSGAGEFGPSAPDSNAARYAAPAANHHTKPTGNPNPNPNTTPQLFQPPTGNAGAAALTEMANQGLQGPAGFGSLAGHASANRSGSTKPPASQSYRSSPPGGFSGRTPDPKSQSLGAGGGQAPVQSMAMRRMLGDQQYVAVRGLLVSQQQQHAQQVSELHRIVAVQRALCSKAPIDGGVLFQAPSSAQLPQARFGQGYQPRPSSAQPAGAQPGNPSQARDGAQAQGLGQMSYNSAQASQPGQQVSPLNSASHGKGFPSQGQAQGSGKSLQKAQSQLGGQPKTSHDSARGRGVNAQQPSGTGLQGGAKPAQRAATYGEGPGMGMPPLAGRAHRHQPAGSAPGYMGPGLGADAGNAGLGWKAPAPVLAGPPPGMPWFAAMMQQNNTFRGAGMAPPPQMAQQAQQAQSAPQAPMDPLSAWYTYHFGQGGYANALNAAAYSNRLAGLDPGIGGWYDAATDYVNFSQPATGSSRSQAEQPRPLEGPPLMWRPPGQPDFNQQQLQQLQMQQRMAAFAGARMGPEAAATAPAEAAVSQGSAKDSEASSELRMPPKKRNSSAQRRGPLGFTRVPSAAAPLPAPAAGPRTGPSEDEATSGARTRPPRRREESPAVSQPKK